jgi:hypothetical protein
MSSKRKGRHCVICGREGGAGMSHALKMVRERAIAAGLKLSWLDKDLEDGKAHGPCVINEQRKIVAKGKKR